MHFIVFKMLYAHSNQMDIFVAKWMNHLHAVREVASSNPVIVPCFCGVFFYIYICIYLFNDTTV